MSSKLQIIHIFLKYEHILRRPSVMKLLTAEREHFVQSMRTLIEEIKVDLTQNGLHQDNFNLSPICFECRWLKVFQHQVN